MAVSHRRESLAFWEQPELVARFAAREPDREPKHEPDIEPDTEPGMEDPDSYYETA